MPAQEDVVYKVMIVDHHCLFTEGLCLLLSKMPYQISVLTADCLYDSLQLAEQHKLDLVILNLELPDTNGLMALTHFKNACPQLSVIIMSACNSIVKMKKAFKLGANGFVCKSASGNEALQAIDTVLKGETYIPAEFQPYINLTENDVPLPPYKFDHTARIASKKIGLTPRQLEVLRCLYEGLSNKEIGDSLKISESTVKVHVTAILKVLNVKSRLRASQIEIDPKMFSK